MAEKKEPLPLTDRQLEIVNMNATDVTDEELTRVLRELSFRDQRRMAQKVWETYWKVSKGTRTKVCMKLGITPQEHKVVGSRDNIYIDGFPYLIFKYLFIDDVSTITGKALTKMRTYFEQTKNADALLLMNVKYEAFYRERYRKKLISWGLPEDTVVDEGTEIPAFNFAHIDGLSIQKWRAFYISDFTPQLSHLKSWIKQYEECGDTTSAEFLKIKYHDVLNQNRKYHHPTMEHEKALAFRDYILSPEYMKQIQEENAKRSENAHGNG